MATFGVKLFSAAPVLFLLSMIQCFNVIDSITSTFNFYKQAITGQNVVIETFAICKSTLVVCFAHLSEVMFYDCLVCAHYNKRTFYRLLIENEGFPRYKCYSRYRHNVKKLLKYFVRFLVSHDH